MERIGVTGHRAIPGELLGHVRERLRTVLRCPGNGPLEALSSLADGADQLFADIALECGADLTVVIPSADYEADFDDPESLARYRRLRDRAAQEVRLDFPHATDEAYYAAGAFIADSCDRLVAVWDGQPARGRGGTGDIVAYARSLGKPVTVIWREGVCRD
ncbi:nucleoside 2-deoxyribosyltransferase [Streptomyces bambusae]|uniref:nucleoside 2-deoxyribosyltransferase n=1 Tax=Streptomyces bambusae TaxID=1550616 RepID=UPI001CFEC272|nr:nucleoside 2-deoxyribosyltransferase [Streptomyces bambusae]MCB5167101.1 nucleoside 2-deoxyribosyltransferase [Streptomyces bambusae]